MQRELNVGAVVLCGGRSSRMGRPKAWLPFGSETMLERVVRIAGEVVQPVVVVAAPGQALPPLPPEVLLTHDDREGRGPLEGLLAGLNCLGGVQPEVDAAFATSCDVPLLAADLVRYLIAQLGNYEIVVPVDDKFHHPLAALYRLSVRPAIEQLLAADRLRPLFLFDNVATRRIPVEQLREVDPSLHSLMNLNHPEDYEQALRLARLES
jgi:molybdenum cofactor guanylyltransferase